MFCVICVIGVHSRDPSALLHLNAQPDPMAFRLSLVALGLLFIAADAKKIGVVTSCPA